MAQPKLTKKKKELNKPKQPNSAGLSSNKWILYAGIFLFVFVLYGNTIKHDYVLDDDITTRGNSFVQQGIKGIGPILQKGYLYGFNGMNDQSYRPLVLINMAIEKQFFGNNPHAHHFFNIFWFALTCVVLFSFLRKLIPNVNFIIPLLITLLFLAHPIHTEVVANIKSRDEILSFLFSVLALRCLLDYHLQNKISYLIWGMVSYFLALIAKENSVTLIAIIPLMFHFFTNRPLKNTIITTLLFSSVLVLYFIIRFNVMDKATFGEMSVINNSLMAAKNGSEKLATEILILGKYLGLLIFPHPLSSDYSYNQIPIVNWTNLGTLLSVSIYAALGIYALFGIKKKDPIAFGILFFLISISIVSNIFIPIGSTLGERFLFTPSLGFSMAFVFALFKILKVKLETGTKPPTAVYGLATLVLLACSFKTIDRNKDWENNFTLFTTDVQSVPNSARAHFAVASSYREAGEREMNPDKRKQFLNLSVEENQKSLKIYPLFEKAYYNLGVSYYNLGDKDNALKAYRGALNLLPDYKDALNNSGVIFFEKGIHDSAMVYFEKVIKIDPNSGGGYGNLGACYHNKGDYTKALFYYEKAISSNQGNTLVYTNMAKIYQILGETEKAKLFFAKASQ
jgi:hypothetical protein